MPARLPLWIIVALAVQLVLALVLFALGWSMTSSLAQGRPPAYADILLLVSPALTVIVCAVLANAAWRGAMRGVAKVLALLPIPAAFLLFAFLGAI